ncbi:hypothetical protein [Cumulibacter soli]|uniref:hypothetical protein n=1 Tax=Cumulibacter soli TaxID=2546344 RepID=UPI001067EF28|nr:hypothetical protein [Cumulibacter soli]
MSETWRIRFGILLLVLGVGGLVLSFGPLNFADRLSSRVDADGVVQWGVSPDALSAEDTVADGEYGAWKVDYQIDGTWHTGVILGSYSGGQSIVVSAPEDGSFYSPLREGTPTGLRVLSWFVLPMSAVVIVIGVWWVATGMRAQDARNREMARQQLARRFPGMFPLPGIGLAPIPNAAPGPATLPGDQAGAHPAQPHTQRTDVDGRKSGPDFFAPYDL